MYSGRISAFDWYAKEEKAEERVSENQKISQNIVDYYFKKNLPLIPPPKLVFKERSILQEEKQMTPGEIAKKITPEGMYVYFEREENRYGHRLHVHTGKKWIVMGVEPFFLEIPEARAMISEAAASTETENEELPRRCSAQRDVLLGIWDTIVVDRDYKKYTNRMGKSLEGRGAWKIEPHEQIKSVQVLQDIVNEEIEKLKVPEAMVKSGLALDMEAEMATSTTKQRDYWAREKKELAERMAEEKAPKNMFDSIAGINSVARGQPEVEQAQKCCGNTKDHVPGGIACWKHI